jgi:two-component system chemotaxis sensor kinase CheA
MTEKEQEFLKRLLSTFKVEAAEHIKAIESGLIEMEQSSDIGKRAQIIESVFREAHSLKGAARAVQATDIEAICQSLETLFASWKDTANAPTRESLDTLHQTLDRLSALVPSEKADSPRPIPVEDSLTTQKPPLMETIRISAPKLNALLLQIEELVSAKQVARQRVAELREIHDLVRTWRSEWSKVQGAARTLKRAQAGKSGGNGRTARLPEMTRVLEFNEWSSGFVQSLEAAVVKLETAAEHDRRAREGMIDNLLEDAKQVLMLPASSFLKTFPKFVRDLSRDQGKETELRIEGGGIEVDRRILEEMRDPIIHLLRNSVDHGIEKPDERERKKKPRRATITLAVAQKEGGKVEILLSDDGAGISPAKVQAAALKLGVISEDQLETLDPREALSLIFRSGVSTSPTITNISGRGLGLAIVREKIEQLGGTVSIETEPDWGTTFRMVLPMTLSTFRGVVVRVDDHVFVIPASRVERAMRVHRDEIQSVENRETILVDGGPVSLVRLHDVLELTAKPSAVSGGSFVHAVVLAFHEKRIAFTVDEILSEQEVLVKSLGPQLARVRNVAAATILASGKVAPILNAADLMQSAVKSGGVRRTDAQSEEVLPRQKSILVAEDSITARTLLKNILETAGFRVKTAVDGVDALTSLKTDDFDLVVSDVDMPRMNGLDLTARIRADKKLSEIPVVLVTALESQEDRERGIEVGANAYIVKKSFEQGNLLDAVRRLV